jgi:hypothetical protein
MPAILGRSLEGFEPHQLSTEELPSRLQVDPARGGSRPREAQRRLVEQGPNELTERFARTPWAILWDQLSAHHGAGALGRRGDAQGSVSGTSGETRMKSVDIFSCRADNTRNTDKYRAGP